jgi:hypothetical protein
MDLTSEQVLGLAILAALAVAALAVVFVAFRAIAWLIRRARGRRSAVTRWEDVPVMSTPPISASDLYAVRANLEAVSRQLADLELKLRVTAARSQ